MKKQHFLYYKIMGCKKIVNSWLKHTALNELREMVDSEIYAKQINFVPNSKSLLTAFRWDRTFQGFKFWKRVNFLMSK